MSDLFRRRVATRPILELVKELIHTILVENISLAQGLPQLCFRRAKPLNQLLLFLQLLLLFLLILSFTPESKALIITLSQVVFELLGRRDLLLLQGNFNLLRPINIPLFQVGLPPIKILSQLLHHIGAAVSFQLTVKIQSLCEYLRDLLLLHGAIPLVGRTLAGTPVVDHDVGDAGRPPVHFTAPGFITRPLHPRFLLD